MKQSAVGRVSAGRASIAIKKPRSDLAGSLTESWVIGRGNFAASIAYPSLAPRSPITKRHSPSNGALEYVGFLVRVGSEYARDRGARAASDMGFERVALACRPPPTRLLGP